jgi:hypothetical protein
MKKYVIPFLLTLAFVPNALSAQSDTELSKEVKEVLFAACGCIDSAFADFQPDFKAFLTSPDILLEDAEERYQALLMGLPQEDKEWVLKNMERIDDGEIDEAIEKCVYHKFSEDYIDELDLDVDYEDEDLMKFLEETDCHLYYLLI